MTAWHRHRYPTTDPAQEFLSDCAYQDGHLGPCDDPRAVIVLDAREPESDTFKDLQRAIDAQPTVGLRALVHAVESLTGSAGQ